MSAVTIYGAPEGYDALLLARRRAEHKGAILHVNRDDTRMARLAEALAFFAPEVEVLRFPAWDCLPYDRVSPNPAIVSDRIACLARLLRAVGAAAHRAHHRQRPGAARAAARRVPRRQPVRAHGRHHRPEDLTRFLEANGYGRADTVMEPGEYAVRGGIVDIFPAGEMDPVRLDLFGDTVESIRRFDATTQRSTDKVDRLELRPVSEIALDPASVTRFREGWRELFGPAAAQDPIYASDLRRPPPSRHGALGAAVPHHDGEPARLPAGRGRQPRQSVGRRAGRAAGDDRGPFRRAQARRRATARCRTGRCRRTGCTWTGPSGTRCWPGPAVPVQPVRQGRGASRHRRRRAARRAVHPGRRPRQPGRVQATGRPVTTWQRDAAARVVAAWTRGSRERLANLLRENGLRAHVAETWQKVRVAPRDHIVLVTLGVERGFLADDLGLVGEQDLLGERISRPPRRRKRADQFIAEATEIAEGDLVVHQDHGIAPLRRAGDAAGERRAARLPAAAV